ncbi:MAG: hypothetical protein GY869_27370, partial [Planctomycetes bacterium]|nr:hypothetical protein [Planctomycetota bacterium]
RSGVGAAYIFQYNGTKWIQIEKLTAPDGVGDDHFGCSVAINENVAIVGAFDDDDNAEDSGSAYIYRYNGTNWVQETKIIPPDAVEDARFGGETAICDNIAIVGAYADDDNGAYSGSAYIFRYDGSDWIQTAKFIASDGKSQDWFGYSVAFDGNYFVAGTLFGDGYGNGSGAAYITSLELEPTPIEIDVDIKPGSSRNPLNVKKQGKFKVAILGSADFDVHSIDVTS